MLPPSKSLVVGILLDLLTGTAAAGLFLLFKIYSYDSGGMRTLLFGAALLYVSAGFLRGNSAPAYSGLKALLLVAGYVTVYTVINPSARFYLVAITMMPYGSALAAIYARRSWSAGARNRSLFILGATLAVAELVCVVGAPRVAVWLTTWTGNVPAPEFSVTRTDGKNVEFSQFKGHVTVLYFCASWCPPCWTEFPRLEKVYERYDSNDYVIFLAIDSTGQSETPEKARAFVESAGSTIPAAFVDRSAVVRLGLRVIPTLLILDKSGHIRLVHAGYDDAEHYVENMTQEIDQLLAE